MIGIKLFIAGVVIYSQIQTSDPVRQLLSNAAGSSGGYPFDRRNDSILYPGEGVYDFADSRYFIHIFCDFLDNVECFFQFGVRIRG
ncbi:hypothetical protein D3C75_673620 [compost metagenome]